jgi:hypothetical protein
MENIELTQEEQNIMEWQYSMMSGFYSALMRAIQKADVHNLERLRLGFPVYVSAFEKYSRVEGWWDEVRPKIRKKINHARDILDEI